MNTLDMLKTKKMTKSRWAIGLAVVGLLILVGCFLSGCGTARGIVGGVERVGVGILQDMKGAVEGINKADDDASEGGGE